MKFLPFGLQIEMLIFSTEANICINCEFEIVIFVLDLNIFVWIFNRENWNYTKLNYFPTVMTFPVSYGGFIFEVSAINYVLALLL